MMAKKWQILYNNSTGWRYYSNPIVTETEARRRLTEAQEGSERLGDGWRYKLTMIEE